MQARRLVQEISRVLDSPSLLGTVGMSAGVFLTRFGGALANFVFSIIIARNLPPSEAGFVFLAMSMATLASLFTTLNIDNSSVRHLLHPYAQGRLAEAAGFMAYTMRVVIRLSPVAMLVFALALVANQHFNDGLSGPELIGITAMALTIPLVTLMRLGSRWGHVLSAIMKGMVSHALIRPVLLCVFSAVFLLWGLRPGVDLFLVAALLACVVALVCQHFLLRKTFAFTKEVTPDTANAPVWVRTGLYLSVTVMLLEYFQNIVVVAAAFSLTQAEIALLDIALRFIGLLRMGIMAVNMAVSPHISRAFAEENVKRGQWLLSMSTHLKFWPTVVVTVLVWWLAPWVVSIFGEDYVAAAWPLRIVALLPLAAAFFGPSIMVLNIVGRQKDIFQVSAITLGLLVIAVPVAGYNFGVIGAALAAAVCVFLWEWALYLRVRMITHVDASVLGALFPALLSARNGTPGASAAAE